MPPPHGTLAGIASKLVGLTVRQIVVPPVWLGMERTASSSPSFPEGLQLEAPFELSTDTGHFELDPAGLETSPGAEHLFGLYGRRITASSVSADGRLEVTFDGAVNLVARPHPEFESWSLVTPVYGAPSVVCVPGGKVVVFEGL